jgi:hypothetical protein
MDGGHGQLVEFLEPEFQRPDAGPRPRRVGVPLAAAAVLAALIAAAVTARPDAPARRPAAPSPGTGSLLAEIPQRAPLFRPIPPLALVPTPRCPTGGCSVLDWVADATQNAVRTAFPGARVVAQMSAFGPSTMGASDPLLARELTARWRGGTVVVDVVQTGPADVALAGSSPVTVRVAGREVTAEARLPAYRIVVRVQHGDQSVADRLRRMLDDPGLMAVR